MLNSVRAVAGHALGNNFPDGVTSTQSGRYIEVRLIDNTGGVPQNRLSLLLRTNNLYLDGFINSHGRFVFHGTDIGTLRSALRTQYPTSSPVTFTELPWSENYTQFSTDNWRRNTPFTALRSHVDRLVAMGTSPGLGTPQAAAIGQALTQLVAATSEAARFQWIQRRIGNTIRNDAGPGLGSAALTRASSYSRSALRPPAGLAPGGRTPWMTDAKDSPACVT
ncbi:ribosome-inactivating family protein [Kitasatospora sp. NPDC018058]|uniref:ribosome-inactivating family protein n=1 Tax=Kitasatospora sp. NPDC018058 TaxID=3364025 RepID=UPI0037C0DAB3